MVVPAPAALQPTDLPDLVLEMIFVRLPPRQFYQYRCLSRAWAAALSSEDAIDRHLHVRGKIRLDYDSIMRKLALGCCLTMGEPDGDIAGLCDFTEEQSFAKDNANDNDHDGADRDDGEETNLREEYRTRGYMEVDEDYCIRMAETPTWLVELLAKVDFREGLPRVPFGALHPRIRQPLMQEQEEQEQGNIVPIRGRVKTEEDIDKEIIAFLRRLRDMDPKSAFLKELDSYGERPYEPRQQYEGMAAFKENGHANDFYHSDPRGVDVDSNTADEII